MTGKELSRVSRRELLEMLIELGKENESLRARLSEKENELNSRVLLVDQAGTLADAAVSVSEVFSSADKAAKLYLDNVQRLEKEAWANYEAMKEKGRVEAAALLSTTRAQANEEAAAILSAAKEEAAAILARAAAQPTEVPPPPPEEPKKRSFPFPWKRKGKNQ